jgi:hypothetical protein
LADLLRVARQMPEYFFFYIRCNECRCNESNNQSAPNLLNRTQSTT